MNKDYIILINEIKNFIREINSIESKGFLNKVSLQTLPIMCDLINEFTTKPKYIFGDKLSESYK